MTTAVTVGVVAALAVLAWPARTGRRAPERLHPWPTPASRAVELTGPRARWRLSLLCRRRDGEGEATLVLLDRLAAALRAGLPPDEALSVATAAGRGTGFGAALRAVAEGRSAAAALARLARVRDDEHLGRAARAWALSERTGAGLAEAVEAAARAGRQAVDHRRQVRAATAGARASVTLLTLLPVGGVGVALLLGLSPTAVYGNPVSLAALGLGVSLLLVGRLVVSRMVRRVEAP